MTIDEYRRFYADEIRIAGNIESPELVRAFATVHREKYLGAPPWQICSGDQAGLAMLGLGGDVYRSSSNACDLYHNVLVAIDPTRYLNNGHPSTLARWIATLELEPGDRVYHAGCGVGYYTAILAELVGSEGTVLAIELDPELAARAGENLSAYPQVSVHSGDGAEFDPGMCNAMLINAGVTHLPRLWLNRLKEGGSIVVPLTGKGGQNYGTGVMVKFTREQHGVSARIVSLVAIYSFSSLRDAETEASLTTALAKRELFKLKSLPLHEHAPADTCLVHTAVICLNSNPLAESV